MVFNHPFDVSFHEAYYSNILRDADIRVSGVTNLNTCQRGKDYQWSALRTNVFKNQRRGTIFFSIKNMLEVTRYSATFVLRY